MPVGVPDVKSSMQGIVNALQEKLDELSQEIFSLSSDGRLKYELAERSELNNLRMKLAHEIYHRELVAAFEEASVQVVRQPTEDEVNALSSLMRKIGKPLDQLADYRAIVTFVEGVMTDSASRFNELAQLIKPKPAAAGALPMAAAGLAS